MLPFLLSKTKNFHCIKEKKFVKRRKNVKIEKKLKLMVG